jgi:cyclohexanone monooxygenase
MVVSIEQRWVEHAAELAAATVYDSADSWYTGANVPGKPRVLLPYVGGVTVFRRTCDKVAEGGYREMSFGSTTNARPANVGAGAS